MNSKRGNDTVKKYIKMHSDHVGVALGFINFYVLFYLWEVSWEISFAVAFSLGYLASKALDSYAGKLTPMDLDNYEAKEISDAASNFEGNGKAS